jgi:hypothetical protein
MTNNGDKRMTKTQWVVIFIIFIMALSSVAGFFLMI